MTWIDLADKHPDSAIILGILVIVGVTLIGCFALMCAGEILQLLGRAVSRYWYKP